MVIPKGCFVAAPIEMLHDEAPEVSNPQSFEGFRYSDLREESSGPTKHQMVNTELNYLLFGHGKHAWYVSDRSDIQKPMILTQPSPGRFLAVAEMKLILATLILEYDMKLIPGTAPKDFYFGTSRVPEMKLPILIKARTPASKN